MEKLKKLSPSGDKKIIIVWFAVLAIIGIAIFAALLFPAAFGYAQEVIDRNGIKDIQIHEISKDTSRITFDFCYNKYTLDTVGALVTSDLDVVPLPIGTDTIRYKDCTTYGTKVLTESPDTVNVTIFNSDSLDGLISLFNVRLHYLKNDLAQINQKISEHEKLNDDATDRLTQKAQILEKQVESAHKGLKTLITMNTKQ